MQNIFADNRVLLEIAGAGLGVAALVFAWKHERDMRAQVKELSALAAELRAQAEGAKVHTSALNEIRKSVLTRYLGPFPDFFHHIIELLGKATNSIDILCDFPAYGAFTCPHECLAYRQLLEKAVDKGVPSVNITILKRKRRRRYIEEQFPEAQWEKTKSTASVKDLLKRSGKNHESTALKRTDFLALLEAEDEKIISSYLPVETFSQIDSDLPIYFWVIDKSEAIFSIPVLSDDAMEYGFTTIDPQFIKALVNMKERYERATLPFPETK